MRPTCGSFICQLLNVYLRLEEASGPRHLVSLADINIAVGIRLKQPGELGWQCKRSCFSFLMFYIQIQMFLWLGLRHYGIKAEASGLRCTYSFIFMAFITLSIYFSGTKSALLWLTYCSILGNMGPEEWGLAYSCLIDVNKKCSFFSFLPLSRCKVSQTLYYKPHSRGRDQLRGEL